MHSSADNPSTEAASTWIRLPQCGRGCRDNPPLSADVTTNLTIIILMSDCGFQRAVPRMRRVYTLALFITLGANIILMALGEENFLI